MLGCVRTWSPFVDVLYWVFWCVHACDHLESKLLMFTLAWCAGNRFYCSVSVCVYLYIRTWHSCLVRSFHFKLWRVCDHFSLIGQCSSSLGVFGSRISCCMWSAPNLRGYICTYVTIPAFFMYLMLGSRAFLLLVECTQT